MADTTFNTPGAWRQWNVPKDVKSVEVTLEGAGSDPAKGGRVTGNLKVNENQVLWIWVGAEGRPAAGTNGRDADGNANTGKGGDGGDGTIHGGGSGGGATILRINGAQGSLKAVAGGAGGRSGDFDSSGNLGRGGHGGASTGEAGTAGTSGTDVVGNATGGTPYQGGNGGTSSVSDNYNGHNAGNGLLDPAGNGGAASGLYGGGGGGGGYRSGGGGQAASANGFTPAGGGGGGSNFTGGLTGAQSQQGTGQATDGRVRLEWLEQKKNQPPNNVNGDSIKIDGQNRNAEGVPTKRKDSVKVTAQLDDPDGDKVRMVVDYRAIATWDGEKQTPTSGPWRTRESDLVKPRDQSGPPSDQESGKAEVVLSPLNENTLYEIRVWAEDSHGKRSLDYTAGKFWTNRSPSAPTLLTPAENTSWPTTSSINFTWNHNDPDPNDGQSAFQLEYWPASDPDTVTKIERETSTRLWVSDPDVFRANAFYEWRVRTRDQQNKWGVWSQPNSFYVSGVATPPLLLSPIKGAAVPADEDVTFTWRFRDPDAGDTQSKADLRYRAYNPDQTDPEADWILVPGLPDPDVPGSQQSWTLPADTFGTGVVYEWQVRTYDSDDNVSQWSYIDTFTRVETGSYVPPLFPTSPNIILGALGCGTYRAYIYAQGGQQILGEVSPVSSLTFDRIRDEISRCNLLVTGFGPDCGELLANLRSWMHEIVLFRDGVRVWEGPVTRLTYTTSGVGIEAKDVMAYLYRRIMRQGYNDAYRKENNQVYGHESIVKRARQIIMNAFSNGDPNVLRYLTTFEYPDDATQGRTVLDYSKTAWEEVDDLAATAGLDYTVAGRRIILWDTHRPIGRLPEMRDGDFSDPPIVSEYGMQLANYYAVTNNSGAWGAAKPKNQTSQNQYYTVPIEILASAWGETDSKKTMTEQAEKNISDRWPTPLVVRVPDNSTLNPEVNVPFNHLIPGVWIPLRATGTLRRVTQWQKLDAVNVEASPDGEQVRVIMSPAPGAGADPDAEVAAEDTE